ncbi:hypothetical protein L798_15336 [Zootermopsis nevadensis]|uniref:Uncharacterized protein n=1 Tax=Zootermopsis nevadensis TaxID=136037 RepID=A0A067QQV5_ZOONE|nr:hypothetical protein L798_15336 [Zootermopsis nevadensis]
MLKISFWMRSLIPTILRHLPFPSSDSRKILLTVVNTAALSYRNFDSGNSTHLEEDVNLPFHQVQMPPCNEVMGSVGLWLPTPSGGVKFHFAGTLPSGSRNVPQASTGTKITNHHINNNIRDEHGGRELRECPGLQAA